MTDAAAALPGAGRALALVGHGFIGRRVAERARARGWSVRVLAGRAEDRVALDQVLAGADHVVHAAGTSRPADAQRDPVAATTDDLAPLLAVLDGVRRHGVAGMTFLSSGGTVYGPGAPVPTPEDAPLWPSSAYGVLKVAAERFVAMHAREAGFAANLLRCANAWGPGQPTSGSQGLVGVARADLAAGRPVTVFGDGSARRDFIHVDDLAEVVLRLAEAPDGVRVLNVGSGRATSILQVVDALARELGVEPVLDLRPARPTDVAVSWLDTSRLRELVDLEMRDIAAGTGGPDR